MKIEISKRARLELERAATWWDDPSILWDELEEAGRRLLENPEAGRRWMSSKGRIVWRLLLPRTQKHLYHAYYPKRGLIVVRCICVECSDGAFGACERPASQTVCKSYLESLRSACGQSSQHATCTGPFREYFLAMGDALCVSGLGGARLASQTDGSVGR